MGEPACFGKHSIVQKVNYCSRIHVCLSERIVLFMGGDPSLKVGRGGGDKVSAWLYLSGVPPYPRNRRKFLSRLCKVIL